MSSSTSSNSSIPEQAFKDAIDKWRPELMNSTKYGPITGLGIGLKLEGSKIKRPHETCIHIYVQERDPRNELIPAFLDGIQTQVFVTGNVMAATS